VVRMLFALTLMLAALAPPARAETAALPPVDTGYEASPTVSLKVQRAFLDSIRWSSGVALRDGMAAAFSERAPGDIWQGLVQADGLTTGNVADALSAYWALNWRVANRAYAARVDMGPVQRQVQAALGNDANFRHMGDQRRQEMAEGYILNFLLEHAALNNALNKRDEVALDALSRAAVLRFRQQMGIDLLALVPGPEGFAPAQREN